jgi:hypothetical protein
MCPRGGPALWLSLVLSELFVRIFRLAHIDGASGTATSLSIRQKIIAGLAFWCATLLLLWLSGSFDHELGGHPDEAAHYMTGLMIHDYVLSGAHSSPLDFAKNYYGHYPKVAFGIWPPLFHAMEAAWMLLFSPSKVSVLIMLSGLTALMAYVLFRSIERSFGFAAGICAGLLLVSLPAVQQSTNLVMADGCVAFFCFLAVVHFGHYLDTGKWQHSALFGIWASAAILSKYDGLALAFVPPLCMLFSHRWDLLRRGATWLPAGIVLVVCGSWYFPMLHLVTYAAEPLPRFSDVLPTMAKNFGVLVEAAGIPVILVAALGAALTLTGRARATFNQSGLWISSAAIIVACWSFHSFVTLEADPRHMVSALAPLLVFLVVGVHELSTIVQRPTLEVASVLLLFYTLGTFQVMATPHLGYAELASALTREHDPSASVILADGDPNSEGMAVSEIAIHDRRPASYVIRGSKLLATSTWMGDNYRPLFHVPEHVLQVLDEAGISVVILQTDAPAAAKHHALLREALRSATDTWQLWSPGPENSRLRSFQVYRRNQPLVGHYCFEVSLERTLNLRLPVCTPQVE